MRYLLRLDLERIRLNLEGIGAPHTEDDVARLLAGFGLWRVNDDWWGADGSALKHFLPDEILERREQA